MRVNRREFAFEKESTPGTAETLDVSDLLVRIRDGDTLEPDFEEFDTEEVQGTSSKRPSLIGRRLFDANMSYILRGPGDQVTVPIIADLLEAAVMVREKVEAQDIGAVTGGPFVDGEALSFAPSGATATAFRDTANGATEIKFVVLTGTPASGDAITGGTSGASATASSGPNDRGYKWQPTDSDYGAGDPLVHGTARLNQDGYQWTGRGCLANLSMLFANGKPATVTQRVLGALESFGDEALLLPATYPEQAIAAPRFLNAGLFLGTTFKPPDIVEMTLNFDNQPEAREDANDASVAGVRFADYDRAVPTLELEPAHVLAATNNWFQELQDGVVFPVTWDLGATDGSRWTSVTNVKSSSNRVRSHGYSCALHEVKSTPLL